MNKKMLIKVAFAILIGVAGMYGASQKAEAELDGLTLENIDALATPEESQSYFCINSGSIDCHGHKVDFMYEHFSLD